MLHAIYCSDRLLKMFDFLGEYSKLSMTDFLLQCRQEYGDTLRVPGVLGKKTILLSFVVDDIKKVFRADGVWPIRPGTEALQFYRKKYHADFFNDIEGLITRYVYLKDVNHHGNGVLNIGA